MERLPLDPTQSPTRVRTHKHTGAPTNTHLHSHSYLRACIYLTYLSRYPEIIGHHLKKWLDTIVTWRCSRLGMGTIRWHPTHTTAYFVDLQGFEVLNAFDDLLLAQPSKAQSHHIVVCCRIQTHPLATAANHLLRIFGLYPDKVATCWIVWL